jgi:hypothetical protein
MKRWIIAIVLALVICFVGFGVSWSTAPANIKVNLIYVKTLKSIAGIIFHVVTIEYKGHEYLCAGGGIIEVKP